MNNNLLKTADAMAEMATIVVATFEKDIAQGYKTRDKRYAIDMLKPFVSAYEAARCLSALRPGDELPGGLVVVPKDLLRIALGLDRKKPLDITTSALVGAGARHDLIAMLAAAKE